MHPLLKAHEREVLGRACGRVLSLDDPDVTPHGHYDAIVALGQLPRSRDDLATLRELLSEDGRLLFLERDEPNVSGLLWSTGYSIVDIHRFAVHEGGIRARRWVRGCARRRRAEPQR